ncbi:MAG: hypothetical protein ACI9O4_001240 [Chitinophagales bacterium]|jgi:uncharacterized protein (DUF2147 family)
MTKFNWILIVLILPLQILLAQDENKIMGKWTNEDQTQVIHVEKKGEVFVGQLAEYMNGDAEVLLDVENKDEEKKKRNILGEDVWLNFVFDPTREIWISGDIYNFKNGNTYNGKIQVEEDELKLTGHYGFFFFLAKTQKWTRVLN